MRNFSKSGDSCCSGGTFLLSAHVFYFLLGASVFLGQESGVLISGLFKLFGGLFFIFWIRGRWASF